ncbi:hypothetical protein CCH79_00003079 [Gambusia affinis]|uniref:Vesicle transport v-SNARE N-terminal domain-containing protein n=1 Tax=Gambusia affinis TaxID=33528 RepID=A0A315VEN2_GAMAF|nr:hypothetical protein CCH79_00003079 [Gambusia affinis]
MADCLTNTDIPLGEEGVHVVDICHELVVTKETRHDELRVYEEPNFFLNKTSTNNSSSNKLVGKIHLKNKDLNLQPHPCRASINRSYCEPRSWSCAHINCQPMATRGKQKGVFCGLYCPLYGSRLTGKGEGEKKRHAANIVWFGNGTRDGHMSSDFETYEQDFGTITAEVTNKIGKIPKLSGEEKTQLVLNVDKQLEEVKELLEQMDLEVREIPIQSRAMYNSRLKSYKQEVEKLEKDFSGQESTSLTRPFHLGRQLIKQASLSTHLSHPSCENTSSTFPLISPFSLVLTRGGRLYSPLHARSQRCDRSPGPCAGSPLLSSFLALATHLPDGSTLLIYSSNQRCLSLFCTTSTQVPQLFDLSLCHSSHEAGTKEES